MPQLNPARLKISIHALRVEGDLHPARWQGWQGISIHALRVEGDAPVPRVFAF